MATKSKKPQSKKKSPAKSSTKNVKKAAPKKAPEPAAPVEETPKIARERTPLAQFIAKARSDGKLTARDVAEKIGVTPQAISAWENTHEVPERQFPALAKALSVDLVKLHEAARESYNALLAKQLAAA
jgi:ribosome-binding protein aMBF1 (putative translation factor)